MKDNSKFKFYAAIFVMAVGFFILRKIQKSNPSMVKNPTPQAQPQSPAQEVQPIKKQEHQPVVTSSPTPIENPNFVSPPNLIPTSSSELYQNFEQNVDPSISKILTENSLNTISFFFKATGIKFNLIETSKIISANIDTDVALSSKGLQLVVNYSSEQSLTVLAARTTLSSDFKNKVMAQYGEDISKLTNENIIPINLQQCLDCFLYDLNKAGAPISNVNPIIFIGKSSQSELVYVINASNISRQKFKSMLETTSFSNKSDF